MRSARSKHLLAFLIDERFRDVDPSAKDSRKLEALMEETFSQQKSQRRDLMSEQGTQLESSPPVRAVQAKFLQSATLPTGALSKSPTVSGASDLIRGETESAKDEEIRILKSKIAALEKNQTAWIHCLQQFLFATIFDSSRQEEQRQRCGSSLLRQGRRSHVMESGWRRSFVRPSKRTRTERCAMISFSTP